MAARSPDEVRVIGAELRRRLPRPRWTRVAIAGASMILIAVGWNLVRAPRRFPSEPASESSIELRQHLSRCRSFSAVELGVEPDWERAASACEKALDRDPIHFEANSLFKRIKLEQQAFEHYASAQKALARLKPEEALDLFAKIPAASFYHRKASPLVAEAREGVKKHAREDCGKYFRARLWSAALSRCEKYMAVACQDMSREQLVAPPGHKLSLSGPIRRREWRPRDETYLTFLRVRARMRPREATWVCPESATLSHTDMGLDAREEVRNEFQRRFPNESMVDALLSYWEGNASDAIVFLQKVREDPGRSELHAAADDLRKQISLVDHLFKAGESALQAEDPERAKEPFEEVLQYDRSVMGDLCDRRPSFFGRNIRQDMASHSYQRGRYWADRADARRACRIWKLGAQFYRGNLQLLQALRYCTEKGRELLHSARRCSDLAEVLELSVAGDGLSEEVQEKRAALECP